MITKKFIEAFFHSKSNFPDRVIGFNFLYNETKEYNEYDTNKFDKTTIKWIKEKEVELRSRITYLTETNSSDNSVNIKEEFNVFEQLYEIQNTKKKWIDSVQNVQNSYNDYLTKMSGKKIKYIIISEAPLLKFSEDKFSCNYILDKNIQSAGSYRTAPFNAVNKILNENYEQKTNEIITADDLIRLCEENGIAFMDLVPIPLPELNTKLREHWSINQDYFIEDEKPRVITFLEIAFEYFLEKTNCTIDSDVKIALMMPPKTALGILNFFINDKNTGNQQLDEIKGKFIIENTNNDAKQFQDRSMRLHKAVVMSGAGGPNEDLIYNAFK